ncbi:AbrB family transcriptional regulator [Klebsiella pneumoniae subsp. pneumoniae]|nr:AbrB family transcriptional regulator [Klebsiella pneumoniae subsp. pneumoniae]
MSLRGVKLSIPRPCYLVAQAIVGCMIARAINPSVFGVLFNNWALVLAILLTTLGDKRPYRLAAGPLQRALPGATGAWGSSPGGASAMVVMAPGVRGRCAAGGAHAVSAGAVCRRRGGAGGALCPGQ